MKAQFEVSEEVWGRVKVASMLACKSIGEVLEPILDKAFPGGLRAGSTDWDAKRGDAIPRSKTVKDTLDVPSESKNPAPIPQPKSAPSVGGVVMSKCQKCFDVFPVTTLVTDHKTGKKFCENCVENMRNGQ